MKSKAYKLLSVVLALAMVFTTCTCAITASAETASGIVMVQGTIDNKAGEIKPGVSTRIFTQNLLAIEDYETVSVASRYKAYYHFYDARGNWVSHSGKWMYGEVTAIDLHAMAAGGSYFRMAIGTIGDAELTPADFPADALTFTKEPQTETLVTVEPEMAQGTIDNKAGEVMPHVGIRVYTKYFLLMSDYAKVSLASGYKAVYHFYDASGNWMSSTDWIQGNITVAQLRAMAGSAVNFSIVVGTTGNADLLVEDFPSGVLTLTLASGLEAPTGPETPVAPEIPAPEIPTDTNVVSPTMAQGTIDKGTIHSHVTIRIHTSELISIDEYEMAVVATGYKVAYHCYDKNGNWLKGSSWLEATDSALEMPTDLIEQESSSATHFRLIVAKLDDADITPNDFSSEDLRLIKDANRYSDFTNEVVFEIGPKVNGPWQEGAIFDGKLFLLNHDEWGKTYDIKTGEIIGSFTCDRTDFFSVHSNSMCFGTEYYDKNDKYPLLYICVYNNYAGQANQYEGHCGVYRITENGSDFKGELVQVIKIGFTEDMNMWKSLPNRGDVCPFGNFIVDTDKNDLYAYVMRDGTQTTRYYKFDLPKVSDGEYNSLFGCKTVTLNVEDIKDQFDTEYSVYLQGADYVDGMILSSSGLGYGREGGAILRLVDLETKTVIKTFDAMGGGVYREPEVVAVDPDTKKVYYGSTDGQLRYLTCIDQYINKPEDPEVPVEPPVEPEEPEIPTEPTLIKGEDGVWYYYENGVKTNTTTLVKYSGKWFYVEDGKWNKSATTLVKYSGKWFYIENGKWDSSNTNILVKYKGKWFYIKNGKWSTSVTNTLIKFKGVWFYIKNGKWDSTIKTICTYKGKKFYIKSGKAQLGFSGKVTIGGKKYTVKGGKIV